MSSARLTGSLDLGSDLARLHADADLKHGS